MWGSNLNFSNWKGEMGKQEPGGGGRCGTGEALVPELEEQQGYKGGREENKSQVGFHFFFFSLSGNRTTGLCLQQRANSISS
jgi:hypothetical protein